MRVPGQDVSAFDVTVQSGAIGGMTAAAFDGPANTPMPLFDLPLTKTLVPKVASGSATPTFTRATSAYVQDHEGVMRQVLSGEARFWGARRVANLVQNSGNFSAGTWVSTPSNLTVTTGIADPFGGTRACNVTENNAGGVTNHILQAGALATPANGSVICFSAFVRQVSSTFIQLTTSTGSLAYINFSFASGTIVGSGNSPLTSGVVALSGGWYRIWFTALSNGTNGFPSVMTIQTASDSRASSYTGDTSKTTTVFGLQAEDVTGQSVQTPSEYVSTGVLSTPYQGANVDGVQYFDTVRLHTQNMVINSADATLNLSANCANDTGTSSQNVVFTAANNSYHYKKISTSDPGLPSGFSFKTGESYTLQFKVRSRDGRPNCGIRISDSVGQSSGATVVALTTTWQTVSISLNMIRDENVQLDIGFDNRSAISGLSSVYTGTSGTIDVMDWMVYKNTPSYSGYFVPTSGSAIGPTDTGTTAPIPSTTLLGYLSEAAGTQLVTPTASIRGLNDASWVASGGTSTTAKTSTGVDGVASSATRVTATGANAVLMQAAPVTAAGNYCASFYIRRVTGTGNVDITVDGGTTWSTVSGSLNSATYSKVQVTGNLALNTARIGIRLVTSGDAVDVDFAQLESGTGATTPMASAGASRNFDSLTYPPTGSFNPLAGSCYAEFQSASWVVNQGIVSTLGGITCHMLYNGSGSLSASDFTVFPGSGALSVNTAYKGASSWIANGNLGVIRSGAGLVNNAIGAAGMNSGATAINICGGQNANVRNIRIYGQKVSDAQLTAMVS